MFIWAYKRRLMIEKNRKPTMGLAWFHVGCNINIFRFIFSVFIFIVRVGRRKIDFVLLLQP